MEQNVLSHLTLSCSDRRHGACAIDDDRQANRKQIAGALSIHKSCCERGLCKVDKASCSPDLGKRRHPVSDVEETLLPTIDADVYDTSPSISASLHLLTFCLCCSGRMLVRAYEPLVGVLGRTAAIEE